MSRKLLVDTSILLDAAMEERAGWAAATLLLDEFAYGEAKGCVSALSLKDVSYVLGEYAGETMSREFVRAVADLLEALPVDAATCREAIGSDEPDFENGLIRACAEKASVDFIISRDEKAFKSSPVKRLSTQDHLDLFCALEEIEI